MGTLVFLFLCNSVYAEKQTNDIAPEKVFVIYVKGNPGNSSVITKATHQKFLGENFLVGTSLLLKNATIRIPTSSILIILEYETRKAWEESAADFDEKWPNTETSKDKPDDSKNLNLDH